MLAAYVILILILIIILIKIYIKIRCPFWSIQPVFQIYNIAYWLSPPKIIQKDMPPINKYYDFYGYGEFIGIYKQIEGSIKEKDSKDRKYILQKKLKQKFSDSVIIIDEAHNITPRDKSYSETGVPKRKAMKGGSYNNLSTQLKRFNESIKIRLIPTF